MLAPLKRLISALCLSVIFGALSHPALAQNLSLKKQFLMPGPVIEGHADLEAECSNCHSSFDLAKDQMTGLCLDCHEDVAEDRSTKTGFHGLSPAASVNNCESCHTDHEGRDADIIVLQVDSFDHNFTRFPLEGTHRPVPCDACHKPEQKYRDAEPACISCHKDQDVHKGELGEQCESCHQPVDWHTLLQFNHDKTDFPLKGLHKNLSCISCHFAQQYQFEETACISCHKASDVHNGANGTQCENCHSEDGWKEQTFDHDKTDFPLRGKHASIPCRACHQKGEVEENTPTDCFSCHANVDVHLGRNGKRCGDCHNTILWSERIFDHSKDTDFPLTGKHEDVSCTQCHIGKIHDPLPLDCGGCHAADDVHHDPEMELCGLCHSTEAWDVINPFDHEFTEFPLIGMHQIVPCDSCHIGNQFASNEKQCISCHAKDDVHEGGLGRDCRQCHTPNAWNIWQFHHKEVTGYALEGKHENLSCDSCHFPDTDPGSTPTVCGNCHRSDDIHSGEFGPHCDRCHGTSNFFELIFIDILSQ